MLASRHRKWILSKNGTWQTGKNVALRLLKLGTLRQGAQPIEMYIA
jgi:hypothetical protein